jgi:hypothetical protein
MTPTNSSTPVKKTVRLSQGTRVILDKNGNVLDVTGVGDVVIDISKLIADVRTKIVSDMAQQADRLQSSNPALAESLRWFSTKEPFDMRDEEALDRISKAHVMSLLRLSNSVSFLTPLDLTRGASVKLVVQTDKGYKTLLETTIF